MRFAAVRHGEYDRSTKALMPYGLDQAVSFFEALKEVTQGPFSIVAGPSLRTRQTGYIGQQVLSGQPITYEELPTDPQVAVSNALDDRIQRFVNIKDMIYRENEQGVLPLLITHNPMMHIIAYNAADAAEMSYANNHFENGTGFFLDEKELLWLPPGSR